MIRQSCGHCRCTSRPKVRCFAQFVMREAEVVGASNQVHSGFQSLKASSRMPTFAAERCQTFTHGAIEAFNQGRIELRASDRPVQQGLCFLKRSQRQLACYLYYPFLFGTFDDGGDTQLRPHLSTGSSPSCSLFHFVSKGTHDALGVG